MSMVRVKSVVRSVVEKACGIPQPFLGLEDLESRTGRLLVEHLSHKAAEDSIRHAPGDVLFCKLRPYLAKSYLPTAPGTGTSELLVMRPGPEVDSRFLFYVTLSTPWVAWADATAYGTKMPRTSWELVSDFRMFLPQLEQQRRIANFLDAEITRIDQLVTLRTRQVHLVEEKRASSLDASFERDTHSPTRLKRLLTARPRYGVLVPQFTEGDGVRFIRVNDLLDLSGRAESLRRIPRELSAQYLRTVTRPGDILLSVVGTMGRSAIVPPELEGANIARAVASLRPRSDVSAELVAAWLTTPNFIRQAVCATSSDTAQPTLGMEDLSNFELSWPSSLSAQRNLLQEVRTIQQHCNRLVGAFQTQSRLLSERRQALITAAVTGQFDVTTASGRNVTEGVSA